MRSARTGARVLNTGLFDMLVTFEALFPGTIGSPYEESGPPLASRSRPCLRHSAVHDVARRRTDVTSMTGTFSAPVGILPDPATGDPPEIDTPPDFTP